MMYTIAELKDFAGDLIVTFNKAGNEYYVGIYSSKCNETTFSKHYNKATAAKIFQELEQNILDGNYCYEDRLEMLTAER